MTDTDARLIRLLNALAADCDDTDGWEDAASTPREAAARIESLTAALDEAFDFLGGVDGATEIRGRILAALGDSK
jgi:hypothetical protein